MTGGSGYLGVHVRRFFDADDFSRRSGMNILDLHGVAAVSDYDVVIHLAARLDKSPETAAETFKTNVEGTVNLLRNMRRDAVFIYASTKDVYGRFADNHAEVDETCQTLYSGQTPLEWSKLIAERYVEYYAHERRFRSCIFRLSTVYAPASEGNTPNFVGHYANALNFGERLQLHGDGGSRRDLLHVDDFSQACSDFVQSVIRHGLYNMGGGAQNTLTLRELVARMEEISGLQAVIDEENPLPAPVPVHYVTNLNLVSQELGWRPAINLNDGLKTLF